MKSYIFKQDRYGPPKYWTGNFDETGAPTIDPNIIKGVCFGSEREAYEAAGPHPRLQTFRVGKRFVTK